MKCEHEHDDGAYVLGALSPTERAAYERHLATCSFCREAVADIAVLPGLLGRLDPADFAKLLDPSLTQPSPPPRRQLNPTLVTAVQKTRRQERKKTRVRVLSTALAAAVLALVVGVGALFVTGNNGAPTPPPGPSIAMTATDDKVPLAAKIDVHSAPGGTRIDLVCYYDDSNPELKPYTVRLMAYGPDDEEDQLGSWVAVPGKEFSMPATTHFATGSLSRLELVRTDGKVLLAYDVP
ncbi:zf-HC2 domain-containing protein [Actinoplanes sp. NPDC051633]|uniref:anti-sigma factor family protein n=1 Tax=Actinoplanes sp. NPDC051633 TaxID=3155670 RepID=UPI00343CA3B1